MSKHNELMGRLKELSQRFSNLKTPPSIAANADMNDGFQIGLFTAYRMLEAVIAGKPVPSGEIAAHLCGPGKQQDETT